MYSSIAIVIPYFGTLDEMFPLWKRSVLNNSTIDFYLFTDNKTVKTEKNLKVINIEFDNYVNILRSKLGEDIVCDQPYKLCDYKPAIGYCFEELLENYDYWGFCDMDMIFGDMRKFIDESILDHYDKIGKHGHLQLFKNVKSMNSLFLDDGEYPEYNWQEVFKTDETCYFDEHSGIQFKVVRNKISIYDIYPVIGDVRPEKRDFWINDKRCIFIWEKGKLFLLNEDNEKREILYCHIQRRKMVMKGFDNKTVIILPGKITHDCPISKNLFYGKGSSTIYSAIRFARKIKKSFARYGIVRNIERSKRRKAMYAFYNRVGW